MNKTVSRGLWYVSGMVVAVCLNYIVGTSKLSNEFLALIGFITSWIAAGDEK